MSAPPAAEATVLPAPAVTPPTLDSLELDLRLALHRMAGSAAEGIRIRSTDRRLRVTGAVASTEIREGIVAYARRQERIDVALELRHPSATTAAAATAALSPDLEDWLAQALPDADARRSFVERPWALCEEMRQAATSLEQLARRYPASTVSGLSAEDRRKLEDLAETLRRDVITSFEKLTQHLEPLTGALTQSSQQSTESRRRAADWRTSGMSTRAAVDQLTAALDTLFTATDTSASVTSGRAARALLTPALTAIGTAITRP
jgi:hypothetical protein